MVLVASWHAPYVGPQLLPFVRRRCAGGPALVPTLASFEFGGDHDARELINRSRTFCWRNPLFEIQAHGSLTCARARRAIRSRCCLCARARRWSSLPALRDSSAFEVLTVGLSTCRTVPVPRAISTYSLFAGSLFIMGTSAA